MTIPRLVEGRTRLFGRLPSRPIDTNPLDEFAGLNRPWKWLRLKEWQGWTMVHPEVYSSMILQDAHYLASSEIYVRDKASGVLHEHAANARGGSLGLARELWGSHPRMAAKGFDLRYDFGSEGGRHTLTIDIAATAKAPAFSGELVLDGSGASAPLSVSSRLPGGTMYTHKALFPASGYLRVGDREIVFDPTRDLAILDEHKSFLPYRTQWVWGTFGTRTADGTPIGANMVDRPELPGEPEESCLWFPGTCEELSDVVFVEHGSEWLVSSFDGRVDVIFTPDGRKDVRHEMGVASIDYFQLYGRYTGTVKSLDGTAYDIDVTGVLESMRMRS
jgi:hypothetical protein